MLLNSKGLCVMIWRLSIASKKEQTKEPLQVLEIKVRRMGQLEIGREWLVK